MSREFTQQDVDQIYQAEQQLRKIGLDVDNEHANQNASVIMNYFEQNPTLPVTVSGIVGFVEANRTQFVFRSSIQHEYDQLYVRFTQAGYNEAHRDLIGAFIKSRNLKVEGDDLLHNWNILVRWCLDSNQPVNNQNLMKALGNILNSPQGQHLRFDRKPTKDWDAVRNQPPGKPDEASPTYTSTGAHPDSWVKPLDGHLKHHREMLNRPSETVEATRRPDPNAEFRAKAEGLVRSIQSNVDRAEAEQILQKAGGWGWPLVLRQIEVYIERRKIERSMAGRMG